MVEPTKDIVRNPPPQNPKAVLATLLRESPPQSSTGSSVRTETSLISSSRTPLFPAEIKDSSQPEIDHITILRRRLPAVARAQPAPIIVGPSPIEPFDSIPRWFYWELLGISAIIFLIQIWNYTLS